MYVCMYVCMYALFVCMYICMYVCMHTSKYAWMWIQTLLINICSLCGYLYVCKYVYACIYSNVTVCMYVCMYVCNELTWQLHVVWDSVWRGRYSYLLRSDSEATGSRKPSRGLRMYYQDSNECENHGHIRWGPSGEVLDRTRISWRSLSYRDRP
jgi:hypothetical protein